MRHVLTILAAAMTAATLTAPAALAGPGDGPSESGAVTRFSEPGVQALFDESARFGHETRPLVAFFNVDSPEMFCAMETAGPGDLQMVETPSGHRYFLLHDDVPVLVFDVTGLGTTPFEVFSQLPAAVCDGGLDPIATGTARVRNKVHFNGSNNTFRHIWDAIGDVTDGDTTWTLTTHRRAEGTLPLTGPPDIEDSVDLVRTGR